MKLSVIVSLSLLLCAGHVWGGAVVIDSFNAFVAAGNDPKDPKGIGSPGVIADGAPTYNDPEDALETGLNVAEVRGGRRQTTCDRELGSAKVSAEALLQSGTNYFLSFSNDLGTAGICQLDYGTAAGGGGLGDLTDGGVNDRMVLAILQIDVLSSVGPPARTAKIQVSATDTEGDTATLEQDIPALAPPPYNMVYLFSNFNLVGSFDWNSVDGLSLLLTGADSTDLAIDQIYTDTLVPEPATMAMLGFAVAGLGGYVRRRRRA